MPNGAVADRERVSRLPLVEALAIPFAMILSTSLRRLRLQESRHFVDLFDRHVLVDFASGQHRGCEIAQAQTLAEFERDLAVAGRFAWLNIELLAQGRQDFFPAAKRA